MLALERWDHYLFVDLSTVREIISPHWVPSWAHRARVAGLTLLSCLLFGYPLFAQNPSLSTLVIPTAVAEGGGVAGQGTPYAAYVRIQGWTACAGSQAYLKIYASTNNEYMWTGSAWSNTTTYSPSNQPVVTIDAGGNWSGWIYAKHNNAVGVSASVRAAKVGATSTNLTSQPKTFTLLTLSSGGNAGWIIRQTSPSVNAGILAYTSGAVVGSYRSEDNGISEGYAYGPGGFKIAVPSGFIDSLVALNDDGTVQHVFVGPWIVSPGQETDASVAGGFAGHGSAQIAPSQLGAGIAHSLTLTIVGESPYTITNARITLPQGWVWSQSAADIDLRGGGTPTASVAGDTVMIEGMTLAGADSLQVSVNNLSPPDSTAWFTFPVSTGTSADSVAPISLYPAVFVHSLPRPIALLKQNDPGGLPLLNNTLVTVRGVVTVANEFGGPSYIEDNSGGLAVYGASFSSSVSRGDEVLVSGLVQPFSGLNEIVNPILHAIVSSGNTTEPLIVTVSQIQNDGGGGVETYEGRLVRLKNVMVPASGSWNANTNYPLTDATGTIQVRIDNNTALVGRAIPASSFDLIGVVGQFVSTPPYLGGYQLMPRSPDDIVSTGPLIASFPVESDITPTTVRVRWTTLREGTTRLRYGRTPSWELGVIAPDDSMRTSHLADLQGLQPATVYHVQVFSVASGDTSFAGGLLVSTASPAQTTGVMRAYFNKSVNTGVATGPSANGNQDLVARLLARVNTARRTIDAALYNLSGTPGPGTDIANALIGAKNRGVRVRVIAEQDNRNRSPLNLLAGSGIPVVTDALDAVNGGVGLMHNKFVVIDAPDGAPDSAWVWTGSWNPTESGTFGDYQNVIEIQDLALARTYVLEFNEMWGSDGAVPSAAASRFGARKTNNTPHRFFIGGHNVECYFSPSDQTTAHINEALNRAEHSIAFALLTFTRADLANTLVAKKQQGVSVRGILDNGTDSGSEYAYLVSQGVDIRLKAGDALFHHKYGLVDATTTSSHAAVITGSHNWTTAAETQNDENTLIVEGSEITNAYFQEFAARYAQFGGTDTLQVAVGDGSPGIPAELALLQNFPNPFNSQTTVSFALPTSGYVRIAVYDILGREIALVIDGPLSAGVHTAGFDAARFSSGVYFCRLQFGGQLRETKMVLLK